MRAVFTFCIIFVILSAAGLAETAAEIVTKAENKEKGKSSEGTFTMKVVTPDYTRTVKMKSYNKGNEKALIIVLAPPKEAGNKTLKIGNEMWTYLKATETSLKLPISMLLQPWNGSDLTNDDLVRETNLARDYSMQMLGDETIEGALCWKIELTPMPNVPVVWDKLIYWVRKSDYNPAQIKFYDERGTLVRTMLFTNIKNMNGRTIPTHWTVVSNTKPGDYTEFIYDNVKFDVNIPDRIFSFGELEK